MFLIDNNLLLNLLHNLIGSTAYYNTIYGSGQGLVFLTNVGCSGVENSLLDCTFDFVTDEVCSSHARDVGVKCERELNLNKVFNS